MGSAPRGRRGPPCILQPHTQRMFPRYRCAACGHSPPPPRPVRRRGRGDTPAYVAASVGRTSRRPRSSGTGDTSRRSCRPSLMPGAAGHPTSRNDGWTDPSRLLSRLQDMRPSVNRRSPAIRGGTLAITNRYAPHGSE